MVFSRKVLELDPAVESERIVCWLRENMRGLRRTGAVLGISGGIDSAVSFALCVRAFGPEKVTALMLPEKDSDPESEQLSRLLAKQFQVQPILECITPVLDGFGCYQRRDAAIKRVLPEYDAEAGYKAKIVLPGNLLDGNTLNIFSLTIVTPDGQEVHKRLPPQEFAQIVAASDFKQRTRMAMLYYHAELRNHAVIGTPNKNEHEQGFFVKHGDGGSDLMPIVHLYKTQVYQLARYLDVPAIIMLGVHKPFANINSQMAMTFSPFMISILGFSTVNDFSRLFSKSENVELLIQRIEREPQQTINSKEN